MLVQWLTQHFEKTQIGFLAIIGAMVWYATRNRQSASQFRNREADRADLKKILSNGDLANAKLNSPKNAPKASPLALPGIRLQGKAHEILGIAENASEAEIQKAYKDAIKLYHPDRIQGEAQSQMKFYQEAAATLNQAKEEMLKRIRG